MSSLENIVILMLAIQVIHSMEELFTEFNKKWYLVKLPLEFFLVLEIIHNLFWTTVVFVNNFPLRIYLLEFFVILMFANSIQHLVWAGMVKKYVPGLMTAPFHLILFLIYYFLLIK